MADQYDRTLLRLGQTDDDKLAPVLAKLLPLVFEDLLTQTNADQRKKIIGVLNHVLTRAKGNTEVQMPVVSMVEKWLSPKLPTSPNAPFFRNLALIFFEVAVPRLPAMEQVGLSLYITNNMAGFQPGADRVAMFIYSIHGFGKMAPDKEQIARCLAAIAEKPANDEGLVALFNAATHFLLIPCGSLEAPSVSGIPSASWAHWKGRLKGKTPADMIALKTSVLKWLGALSADPPMSLVYVPSLVAVAENYDAVSSMAENNIRKLEKDLDLDADSDLIGRLICTGLTSAPPGQEGATGNLQVAAKANVPSKLRKRIVTILQRAKGIGRAEFSAHIVHLIRQCLRDHEDVQMATLTLGTALSEVCDPELLPATSAAVLLELEAVFWPGGGVIAMGPATPAAFRLFGCFTRQLAERPSSEGRIIAARAAPQMLRLLDANPNAAHDILEALTGLVSCVRGATEEERKEFVPVLDLLVASPKAVVRKEVLRWAAALFPSTSPEARYYALRLFTDPDPDIVKSAEHTLSGGGKDVPPFASMCVFLAARALGPEVAANVESRLAGHLEGLAAQPPVLPALLSGFSRRDIARCLSFLLGLAEAEGLQQTASGGGGEPVAKKPRLAQASGDGGAVPEGALPIESLSAFVALLDYLLADVLLGSSSMQTDLVADGETTLEVGIRALLLAADLAPGQGVLLASVVRRAELALLTDGPGSALYREGGLAAGRARHLGARAIGSLCEQLAKDPNDPTSKWLDGLLAVLKAPGSSSRRSGAVLGLCEVLRSRPLGARGVEITRASLELLLPASEADAELLTAACDALRRLSERQRLVWEALEAGGGGFASRKELLDRLHELSKPADGIDEPLAVAHAGWRFLGQLAAWGGEGSEDCVDRLVAVGRKSRGEESAAAIGLALAASCLEPATVGAMGPPAGARAEALIKRLMTLAGCDEEALAEKPADSSEKPEDSTEKPKLTAEEQAAKVKLTADEQAAKVMDQRCGVVWLAVLLRKLARTGHQFEWLNELLGPLIRLFVRSIGEISMFTADTGLRALCYLYRLALVDARPELLKILFSSVSNRTVVSNMFVGTRNFGEEEKKAGNASTDSLKITAKERMDAIKDQIFVARDMAHPPLFIGLLDQPSSSAWTGEIIREALDLQSSCLPDDLRDHLCPAALRPKLVVHFYHPVAPVRQAVVALCSNYFACESPQQLCTKYEADWQLIAKNLVAALGSSRVTTREAAIHATQVLFQGKMWSDVSAVFEDFWFVVIKLMDDMETRIQAIVKPLVRMTRNLTLRLTDIKTSPIKEVEEVMKIIVPMLLKFCERHKHATGFCLDVLREMAKAATGTELLSPYVQDLVPPLLVSLSMMENQQYEYYQMHIGVSKDSETREKGQELEAARISASRDSESMKLVRHLIPLMTEDNALALGPRSRELLHRGVGANTRVGVCDFWAQVCAERPSVVPVGGAVASAMLRSVAGALLDSSSQVRKAAASCFASFARRCVPALLTQVITERLLQQDKEHRTDDAQRSSFRLSLGRALWEVTRRCDDAFLEADLKTAIAAKAFGLRYSEDKEVQSCWESLWGELCTSTSAGIERHYKEISVELAAAFTDSASRAEKVAMSKAISNFCTQLEKKSPRPNWNEDTAVVALHGAVLAAIQSLPVFDGIGTLVKGLADIAALLHRRTRNDDTAPAPVDEATSGVPLVRSFCSKGSLPDRGSAMKALMEVVSAARLWSPPDEVAQLHESVGAHVDALTKELAEEEREPGEPVPIKHRGKAQSPAEELITAVLDFWAQTFEQCRKEVEDEGDLEPPEIKELTRFFSSTLAEFYVGSLNMRLSIVRFWKRVLGHLRDEKIAVLERLDVQVAGKMLAAMQDAALDKRSERLRKPAMEFAAALAKDTSAGGGRAVFTQGLAAALAGQADGSGLAAQPVGEWLGNLDAITTEQCAESVAALRELV